MTEQSYDEIDDLFAQIRIRLAKVRQSDPTTADDLKSLVVQVEFWVESLVIDSLKLKSLVSAAQQTKASTKRPRKSPGKK